MIPTILLDPATVFLAGALVAVASNRLLRSRGEVELDRTGLLGAAYGLWYGVVRGYFFFVYSDWMLAYLQDAGQIYKPVAYAIYLFVLTATGGAGALAVGWLLRRGRRNLALILASAGFAGVVSILFISWFQYGRLGTYEEFLQGKAPSVGAVQPFQSAATVCGYLLVIPFVALIGWSLYRSRATPSSISGAEAPSSAPRSK